MNNTTNPTNRILPLPDIIRLAPIIMITSVIFLLVGLHTYTMPVSQFAYLAGGDNTLMFDTMSWVKMVAVIATACIAAVLLIYYLANGKRTIRRSCIYIPMIVYAFTIVISYAFSDYKQFALWGTFDRFEGTIVHLCYLFMMFYAINCVDGEKELSFIADTLFVAVTVACLIGVTQLTGHDFFDSTLGKLLLLGSHAGEFDLYMGSGGVYQTVYNINYVAFYLCMVVPILLNRIIDVTFDRENHPSRVSYRAWLIALFGLIIINIAGASSVGSIPGLVFAVIAVLTVRFTKAHRLRSILIIPAAYAVMAVLVSTGVFGSRFSPFIKSATDRPSIDEISMHDNTVEISVNGNRIIAEYGADEGGFSVRNELGQDYALFTLPGKEDRYEFDNDALMGLVAFTPFMQDDIVFAQFDIAGEHFTFAFTPQGPRYINASGKTEPIETAEHAGIFRNYSFSNGRGYIWDTAIPLVPRYIFCGAGADTFMFIFPQNDYITRFENTLWTGALYDKPHNMYLQIALSFGLTGLFAFIGMMTGAIVLAIKRFKEGKITSLTASVLIGITAFLMSALVNDSSVSVMPMFYGLLGTAIACCNKQSSDSE